MISETRWLSIIYVNYNYAAVLGEIAKFVDH